MVFRSLAKLGMWEEALSEYEASKAVIRHTCGSATVQELQVETQVTRLLSDNGMNEQCLTPASNAALLAQNLLGAHSIVSTQAMTRLGQVYMNLRQPGDAIGPLEAAVEGCRARDPPDVKAEAVAHDLLCDAYTELSHLRAALTHVEASMELYERMAGHTAPYLNCLYKVATTVQKLGTVSLLNVTAPHGTTPDHPDDLESHAAHYAAAIQQQITDAKGAAMRLRAISLFEHLIDCLTAVAIDRESRVVATELEGMEGSLVDRIVKVMLHVVELRMLSLPIHVRKEFAVQVSRYTQRCSVAGLAGESSGSLLQTDPLASFYRDSSSHMPAMRVSQSVAANGQPTPQVLRFAALACLETRPATDVELHCYRLLEMDKWAEGRLPLFRLEPTARFDGLLREVLAPAALPADGFEVVPGDAFFVLLDLARAFWPTEHKQAACLAQTDQWSDRQIESERRSMRDGQRLQ
uniref:Uncharacterized protein n=1 Tax=Vitrella brassicaformis TaxID=1169539 RepID=A0A7S1KL95_9ALVE